MSTSKKPQSRGAPAADAKPQGPHDAHTSVGRLRCFREGTGASAEEVAGNPNLDEDARALAREYLAIQQAMAEKAAQMIEMHHPGSDWVNGGYLIEKLAANVRSLAGAEPHDKKFIATRYKLDKEQHLVAEEERDLTEQINTALRPKQ